MTISSENCFHIFFLVFDLKGFAFSLITLQQMTVSFNNDFQNSLSLLCLMSSKPLILPSLIQTELITLKVDEPLTCFPERHMDGWKQQKQSNSDRLPSSTFKFSYEQTQPSLSQLHPKSIYNLSIKNGANWFPNLKQLQTSVWVSGRDLSQRPSSMKRLGAHMQRILKFIIHSICLTALTLFVCSKTHEFCNDSSSKINFIKSIYLSISSQPFQLIGVSTTFESKLNERMSVLQKVPANSSTNFTPTFKP